MRGAPIFTQKVAKDRPALRVRVSLHALMLGLRRPEQLPVGVEGAVGIAQRMAVLAEDDGATHQGVLPWPGSTSCTKLTCVGA